MKKTLIVIDMQNDFISGSLGSPEALAIVDRVRRKIRSYADRGDEIIFTRDTHEEDYLESNEGRHLPVKHCIKGSKGWELADGLYVEGAKIVDKPNFGFLGWKDYELEEVELVGLCTDICVLSNALILKAQYPEISVSVDASCCAGASPEGHRAALANMKSCQVSVKEMEER